MKETSIPLNSMDNDNESEHLLDKDNDTNINTNSNTNIITNSNINTNIINNNINNNYNHINTNNLIIPRKQKLVPTSKVVTISFKGKPLERIEDRTIFCYRRRKMPENMGKLRGYITTLIFFAFFSILFTVTLSSAQNMKAMEESTKSSYYYIITFMWIFSILSMISLTDAATADPGRQRGTPIMKSKFDGAKIRKIVGGKKYSLKYCTTCHIIRDVRTFHCNTCGLCVEKHDHHCGYISNCVGIYNYKKFFIFVNLAYIHVSIIFWTCVHFCFKYGSSIESAEAYILFLVIFIMMFGGFFEFFVFWMIVQHIQIIVLNRTTREFIKHKEYDVYNRGCKKNCNEAFCQTNIKEI